MTHWAVIDSSTVQFEVAVYFKIYLEIGVYFKVDREVNVKEKFTMWHATKAQKELQYSLPIYNLGARRGWVFSAKSRPHYPRERDQAPIVRHRIEILFYGRLLLKCGGTRAETRLRLSAKRTSPFKSAGASFSRLPAAEVCASAVVMLDTPCPEVVWRVLATHSIRQFPLHFPSHASPCTITFQLDSKIERI